MTARTKYWKLGLFVVVGMLVGLAAIVWIGASRLARETITAYAYFDESVGGLEVGSPVKFRGVTIGKVADIATGPDRRHVEVEADLFTDALERLGLRDPEIRPQPGVDPFLPQGLRVQIVTSPLTGLSYLQGDFFDKRKYPLPTYPFEVPWNTIQSVPSTFKSLEADLMETLSYLPPLTEQATRLITRIESALDEVQAGDLASQARALLDGLTRQVDVAADVHLIERSAEAMQTATDALAEMHALAADLRRDEGPLQRVADRIDRVGQRLEQELQAADVAQTTASLRRTGSRLAAAADELARLGGASAELRDMLVAVRRLAELLERDPAALLRGRTTPTAPVPRENR